MKAKHRAVAECIQAQARMHGIEMPMAVALDLAGNAMIVMADDDEPDQRTDNDSGQMWSPAQAVRQ